MCSNIVTPCSQIAIMPAYGKSADSGLGANCHFYHLVLPVPKKTISMGKIS